MASIPSSTDQDFRKFLEKIVTQNNESIGVQLFQLKAEREVAGEDDDRREQQLDTLIESIKNLGVAVTGKALEINVQPVVDELGNQTKILLKSLEELTLTRKVSEGSLEYDKDSAQYRNTSGRDVESTVSGKTIKQGGYIDFESAADRLTGQGKRVREQNKLTLNQPSSSIGAAVNKAIGRDRNRDQFTGFKVDEKDISWGMVGREMLSKLRREKGPEAYSVEKEHYGKVFEREGLGSKEEGMLDYERKDRANELKQLGIPDVKADADNVRTPIEVLEDTSKTDLEITKSSNQILIEQLDVLKQIKKALSPDTPEMKKVYAKNPSDLSGGLESEEKESVSLPGIDLPGKGKKVRSTKAGKIGRAAGKGVGVAARVAGPLALAYGAYEVGSAAVNAGDYLGLEEGTEPTIGQRIAAGTGALAETATLGLVDGRELGSILAQTPEGKEKALENMRAVSDTTVGDVSEFAGMSGEDYSQPAITPVPTKSIGAAINSTTIDNNIMKEAAKTIQSIAPVINNSVSNNTKNNYVPMKPTPRSVSSLDRYQDSVSTFT